MIVLFSFTMAYLNEILFVKSGIVGKNSSITQLFNLQFFFLFHKILPLNHKHGAMKTKLPSHKLSLSAFLTFTLLFFSRLLPAQCNVSNTGSGSAPTCTNQSLSLGAGESRNIAYTAGVTYTFSFTNNTQSNGICVNGTQYTSNPVNLTPSGTIATGMFRNTGTWTFSSATLSYKIADPTTASISSTPTAVCAGGTTAALTGNSAGVGTGTWTCTAAPAGGSTSHITFNSVNSGTSTVTVNSVAVAGNYTLQWQINNGGCTSTATTTLTVSDRPSITSNPTAPSAICAGGTTAAMSIAASGGTPSLTYQWQYSADNSSWSNVANGTPSGSSYTNGTSASGFVVAGISGAGTYYYRGLALASGAGCTTAASNSASISVVAAPSILSDPIAPPVICAGGSVSGLSFSATGGTPSLSYQWQYSADNTSWSNVSNGTPAGSSYSNATVASGFGVAGISAAGTYYYRGLANSAGSGCASAASNSVSLVVNEDPSITSASLSNTTVCLGGFVTATAVATGGTPSLQYQWQYKNGSTWVNVASNLPSGFSYSNATSATMTINTALNASSGSFGYRCLVSASGIGCGSAVSSILTLSSNSAIWLGNSSDWNDPNNWSTGCVPNACNINVSIGTTANGPVVSTPVGVRNVTITGNVTITLNADLSICGNWSGGNAVLTGTGAVVFARTAAGDQLISGNTEFNNLTIARPAWFVRTRGNTSNLSVKTALRIQSGTLATTAVPITLLSSASGTAYVDDFSGGYTGTLIGKLNMQRYATGVGAGPRTQHQISIGLGAVRVTNFTSSLGLTGADGQMLLPDGNCTGLLSNSPYSNLMQWVPSSVGSCLLEGYQTRTTGFTQQGRGYVANVPNNITLSYSGNYVTGSLPTAVVNTGNLTQNGYNFIGNPYASGMTHAAQAGMDANALVYVPSGDYSGTYQVLSPGGSIASSQGFWVRVTNPGTVNYNFNNSMRVTGNPTWYREARDNSLVFEVESDGFKDMTTVAFAPEAGAGWDAEFDAGKLLSAEGRPTVFTMIGNQRSALNTLKSPEETSSVPMGVQCSRPGTVKISIKESLVSSDNEVYLEDKQTGLMHNLSRSEYQYNESCNQSSSENRFMIHFKKSSGELEATPNIFSSGNKIFVDMTMLSGVEARIEVYNMMGQKLTEDELKESILWSREMNQTDLMYAIVRVNNKGVVSSRKVMLGNR